jgi:FixJ family two-component response regulator
MSSDVPVVYIVEDDMSFRTSIDRLLRASGFETISFERAEEFLNEPTLRRPACLLLDVQLPAIDGLELQEMLIARGISLPVVFMTGHGSIQMGVQAIKRGAADFLPKPIDTAELEAAILAAIARDTETLGREGEVEEALSLIASLTPRENEVLRWVIAGKLNKQIAFALGTTEKTVKVHRAHVMQKTRVASVADLVRLAERCGIFPAV